MGLRLRRLIKPSDHARLQEFLGRDLPGYLIHGDIYVDITNAEAQRLASRNQRAEARRLASRNLHRYGDRIELWRPVTIPMS